jgi:hypothetical protein
MVMESNNANGKKDVQYIVRRLTPTECARLQGFPDTWGHPDKKDDFTDEEYAFWLDVRNTWASINNKAVKQYTKEQMVKWYNKLHTDSAEYEMWGNGIALPNALFVMQGIARELKRTKMGNNNESRKTGYWVGRCGHTMTYTCSVCGEESLYEQGTYDGVCSKFCPCCGARMGAAVDE